MTTFKEWLNDDHSQNITQKAVLRFLRTPNARDAGLPLAAIVMHQAIKSEMDKGRKDKLIQLYDILTKLGE